MTLEILRENEYGCLKVDCSLGNPVLHLKINKWSHNIFKKIIIPMWIDILSELKEKGYKAVYACVPSTEKKTIKFHSIMGMDVVLEEKGQTLSGRKL